MAQNASGALTGAIARCRDEAPVVSVGAGALSHYVCRSDRPPNVSDRKEVLQKAEPR